MTKNRKMKGTYSTVQKRGSGGERLCFWCEKPVTPPKRSFCSQACVHEWKLRSNPGYVRECLKERDHGICALCDLDCELMKRRLHTLRKKTNEWEAQVALLKIPKGRAFGSLWDADHIIPVCEGGGETGLENFRTLCIWCHRKETNKLLARRAEDAAEVDIDE